MEPLDSVRNQSHRYGPREGTGKFADLGKPSILEPPSRADTEQSGETIEDVHRRHQNSQLLEEYSRMRQKASQKSNDTSLALMHPLNLAKI